ncbi:hypothetical protein AAG612_04870 [Citromicrobium bathyomarinum]|uniref:hypothetical protein n=1 Tax=Citromicrobium bathyomarinum TaxID=72174 RepID=UPI00315B1723
MATNRKSITLSDMQDALYRAQIAQGVYPAAGGFLLPSGEAVPIGRVVQDRMDFKQHS